MSMARKARIQAKREALPLNCPENCTRSMVMTESVDICKPVHALADRLWMEIVAPVLKLDRAGQPLREYDLAIHKLELRSLGSDDSTGIF